MTTQVLLVVGGLGAGAWTKVDDTIHQHLLVAEEVVEHRRWLHQEEWWKWWIWYCCSSISNIISSIRTAKATGGAISFYDGKTVHVFTNSGDFNNTSGQISVEYLVIGGGGGGGSRFGGGGGAGAYRTATGFTVSPGPNTVTVGGGAKWCYKRWTWHRGSRSRINGGGNSVFSDQ